MGSNVSIVIPPDDPERTYTPDEEYQLTENLLALLRGVHEGAFSHVPLGTTLLRALHRNIFEGVRLHAGRPRGVNGGSEYLTFGPHRSCHRSDVEAALEEIFTQASRQLASLDENVTAPNYEHAALHLAVWLHAQVIWIHPFEDGNGRTSRALMDVVLVRLGLKPVPLDAPKQEYVDALNQFYRTGDINVLMDLTLGLYEAG
jgi:Fic family protein